MGACTSPAYPVLDPGCLIGKGPQNETIISVSVSGALRGPALALNPCARLGGPFGVPELRLLS